MFLWVLSLLVIAASLSYFVIMFADKQDNKFIRLVGYMVGGICLTAIGLSTLVRIYNVLTRCS